MDTSQPDLIAGRYQVRERLGRGGMGVVYLAYDQELPRLVAVKLLRNNDPDLYERFAREARLAASLDHPNIVTIFDRGIHDGQPFIVMQYVAGETLEELIKRRAPLPLARKIRLAADLCDGLASAHGAGVVHRDVKPSNIKISREGILKILDFGIARQVESGMTRAGSVIGTLNYMSPEQVSGDPVDHRSDQFSVGLVLYELLVFQKAFQGDERVVPSLIQTTEPRPLEGFNANLPGDLVRVIGRATRKSPAERYPDLTAMREELLRIGETLDQALPHLVPRDGDVDRTQDLPKKPGTGSRSDHGRFAERRRAEIERLLGWAQEALAQGDFDNVMALGEQAAILDPDDQRILDLLARATAGLEDRQVREWLAQAQRHLAAGEVTAAFDLVAQALDLRPEDRTALTLQRNLNQVQEERERAAQRSRVAQQALAHARRALEEQAFESAMRSASEALAVDPTNTEASGVREQARAALQARQQQEESARRQREDAARRRLEEDERRRLEQEGRLAAEEATRRDALAEAERRRLDEARRHRAQAEAEAQRRGEAEAAEHHRRQIDDVAARVAAALLAEDLGAAEAALADLQPLAGGEQVRQQLRLRIDAHRAALGERQKRGEHDRLAAVVVEASRTEFERGHVADALRRLEAFAPPHPAVTAALEGLRRIADADDRQRRARAAADEASQRRGVVEKLAAAREQLARGAFPEALASVSAALAIAPGTREALELQKEILASQAESEVRLRAQQAVDEANRLAGTGAFRPAIERLEGFAPTHPLVNRSLDTLKVLAANFERRASEAITSARHLFESGNEVEALAALESFAPAHPGVSDVFRTLSARLDAVERNATPTRLAAEELARQGQLKDAIALLEPLASPPPSVRTALHALREQYTHQLQQQAAQERARGDSYDRAVARIRTALARRDLAECERLLRTSKAEFPDSAELELLAEELAQQRRAAVLPDKKTGQAATSKTVWIAGAAACAVVAVGAILTYRLTAPDAPVKEMAGSPPTEVTTTVPTTTSIPVPTGERGITTTIAPLPPPPPPPPGAEVTNQARALLESGDRVRAIAALDAGLRDARTQGAFATFTDAYLGQIQSDVSGRADRARQDGAAWTPSFRNAENEARQAQSMIRSNRTEALQHHWNAIDGYDRALTEHAQTRKVVETSEGLFQAGRRDDALSELARPGTNHLQSPEAGALLQGMRGEAEAKVQGARTRAVDSGAGNDTPGFRNATAVYTTATGLLREGRTPDGLKGLWEAERLFTSAIVPKIVKIDPQPPPPSPPAGVSDQTLRSVLDRFKQAYNSGRTAQLEQAFPLLKEEAKLYRQQLGACKDVSIDFSNFKVVGKDPAGPSAVVQTTTLYNCVPKVGRSLPGVEQTDQFSLAQESDGTWTITRKWK